MEIISAFLYDTLSVFIASGTFGMIIISEFVDGGYTKITPKDDPNTYVGNFKSPTSVTGYEPNFIRATESLIPLIIKGEDVNIIAYLDAPRNKVAADKLRKKIADTYYKNIIESAYGVVSCDMNISAKELKKKSKGNLGKVTFYFCAVFKDDPVLTVIEATK